jgi:hypothetical protein
MTSDNEAAALRAAIDLVHLPTRLRHLRLAPLPEGLHILLRVVSGDEEALDEAARLCGRSASIIREAAEFFIEQILFLPGADNYRVLGARHDAPMAELRCNMILLLKWLHPDTQPYCERSVFASRVLLAWSDLKTPDRRRTYDEALTSAEARRAAASRRAGEIARH